MAVGLTAAVAVVVEASAPTVYTRVALASASTLSEPVVRTLRGGEGLPKTFCLALLLSLFRHGAKSPIVQEERLAYSPYR